MALTLVMTESLGDRITELSSLPVETGGVLLARAVPTSEGDMRLLATRLIEVPDAAYDRRDSDQLLIRSEGYVPALAEAADAEAVAIWFHVHPGANADPSPSERDRRVDGALNDLFRLRIGSEFYGTLIVAPGTESFRFTGRLDRDCSSVPIDRVWIVGSRLALLTSDAADTSAPSPVFDRNVRAFGGPIQCALAGLRVAIVGCGGTGSAVAEQLSRLGVRRLDLIDPDELSASNVTRVYGSTMSDIARAKVDVLFDHLTAMMPGMAIRAYQASITDQRAARRLLSADVIFGCTDDNAGRLVLSRLSSYLLVPVIDCGVLLSADSDGHLIGIDGRVTVLHPGQACLVCRGRVDMARASSELLRDDERMRLVGEGYAPALPGVEPAVVAYTTAVAAAAVAELIERLTHYGAEPAPSEVLLRLHERELSTNRQDPLPDHYCDPNSGKLGIGLTEPFLEQAW